MSRNSLALFLATLAVVFAGGLSAAEKSAAKDHAHPPPSKKMRMGEPMTGGMMKQGMMKGDVKKAADKSSEKMQPMMEEEQKAMPPEKAKP